MREIVGRKVGMTRLFDADGTAFPVTVIAAGPCPVVARRTREKDGHDALTVGFESAKERLVSKPKAGQFKRAGVVRAGYAVGDAALAARRCFVFSYHYLDCGQLPGDSLRDRWP